MSVLTHLENISGKLVLTDIEKTSISSSINTLKTRLNDYFVDQVKEQLQFGSSTRGTILPRKADLNSDIDYMIIFDNTNNYKPQTFIDRLKRFAEAKYSTSEIAQSHPTVSLKLNHIKFDLVPAHKDWWGNINIPGHKSSFTEWITTDPNGFNQTLTNKNQANYSLIKPMIRLVKYWNAQKDYVYESFELEKSLVNNSYWSCYNLRDYFYSAIENLSTWDLPAYKEEKVKQAKEIVKKTKKFESDNMPASAEMEIKKLAPDM